MATVSEVAVRYATHGAKKAQRADRKVRDSIQTTAKTAQSEQGTINRWMDRHASAIRKIQLTAAAALGGIIAASPTMRAELAGVRMAFSLFADTIVNDVLPSGRGLTDLAFDLLDAYEDLPGPIREVASATILLGAVFAVVALAVGAKVAAIVALVVGVIWLLDRLGLLDPILWALEKVFNAIAWVAENVLVPVLEEIADALEWIWDEAEPVRSVMSDIWDFAEDTIPDALGWLIGAVTTARDRVEDVLSALKEIAETTWDTVLEIAMKILPDDAASGVGGAARSAADPLGIGERAGLPGFRHGGEVVRGGLARVHEGNRIVSAAEGRRGGGASGGPTSIVFERGAIEVDGAGSPKRTAEMTAREVSRSLQDEFGARR